MSFKKAKILFVCLAGCLLALPVTAIAGADSGFYIGAGTGNATLDEGGSDGSDTGYKVFAGYNIGFIPLVDFAVEASYVDFGSPVTGSGSVDVSGINAFGLVGASFGPFGVFAKAGMINWDLDTSAGSESATDPAYGVGARFAIGSFAVRAEYEVYDLDTDLEMISISGVFTF
ncbi:porin family protein [Cardiobacterium sp. AH-315-I02]|nr:porin family protein [Cardiobacterium sp. AH-315-I02]